MKKALLSFVVMSVILATCLIVIYGAKSFDCNYYYDVQGQPERSCWFGPANRQHYPVRINGFFSLQSPRLFFKFGLQSGPIILFFGLSYRTCEMTGRQPGETCVVLSFSPNDGISWFNSGVNPKEGTFIDIEPN